MSSLTHDLIQRYPETIEYLFSSFGYSNFINYFAFIPMLILGFIGFVGNLLAALLSRRLSVKFPLIGLYRYMFIFCINSSINCFIFMFNFFLFSIRTFPWIMSKAGLIFAIYPYSGITNSCYFYSTVLSILVLWDRSYVLRGKKSLIENKHIYPVCLVALLVVISLNIPFFVTLSPGSTVIDLYQTDSNGTLYTNESLRWWYFTQSEFSTSLYGRILTMCLNVFRDGILLVVEISLNILILYQLRAYVMKKNRIVADSSSLEQSTSSSPNSNRKTQTKMTKAVICLSTLSILEHLITLFVLVLPYLPIFSISNMITFSAVAFFCYCVKYGSNFLVLLMFNSNYRQELNNLSFF